MHIKREREREREREKREKERERASEREILKNNFLYLMIISLCHDLKYNWVYYKKLEIKATRDQWNDMKSNDTNLE